MLRPYQERAIELLRQRWRDRPLLCLATGAGKTVIAKAIADGALAKGNKVLVVAHTRQIIEQTARRFDCPMVMAEHRGEGPMLVASVQTLAKRGAPPHDLLIVDEAHHATARTYRDLVTNAKYVIGLTATPQRLDGRGLGDVGFGAIVEPVTVAELIRDKYLAEPIIYAVPFVGSGLVKQHGEFTTASAEDSMKTLHGKIAEHWVTHGRGRLGVAFACSVAHAEQLCAALEDVGARALTVSGRDNSTRRTLILEQLKQRSIDLVVNCQLYGEGWDLPDLDLCIMARPTASLTVYRQQLGRIMRPKSDPNAPRPICLDHAGNVARHGFVTEAIEWSLEGRPKREKQEAPGKLCDNCFAYVPISCTECPACGEPFEVQQRTLVQTTEKLVRIDPPETKALAYAAWLDVAWSRGYRIGWARRKFKNQYGGWPAMKPIEQQHYPCKAHKFETKTTDAGYRYTRCEWCSATP